MESTTAPRRRRVVVCRGQYCNMDGRADKLINRLQEQVDAINGDQYPRPVRLETANCLSMCGAGPNVVIYPEDAVFNHLTPDALQTVIDALLRGPDEA